MNDYVSSIMRYKSSLQVIKDWLKTGIISKSEYAKLETKLCEISGLSLDSIYRDNEWI